MRWVCACTELLSSVFRVICAKIILWEEVQAGPADGAAGGGGKCVADRDLAAETAQLLVYRPKRRAVKVYNHSFLNSEEEMKERQRRTEK